MKKYYLEIKELEIEPYQHAVYRLKDLQPGEWVDPLNVDRVGLFSFKPDEHIDNEYAVDETHPIAEVLKCKLNAIHERRAKSELAQMFRQMSFVDRLIFLFIGQSLFERSDFRWKI